MKNTTVVLMTTALNLAACRGGLQPATDGQLESTATVPEQAQDRLGYKLSGSRLGQGKSRNLAKAFNTAYRFYMHEAKDEPGSYNVILYEYANIPGIAPQYLAARVAPKVNEWIGYLKHIGDNVQVYKMRPTSEAKVFKLFTFKSDGKSLSVNDQNPVMTLTLSEKGSAEDPLAGAQLMPTDNEGFNVYFPYEGDKKIHAPQYLLAATAYKLAKLDSTWRKNWLTGPFLAAYGKIDDVAVKLSEKGGAASALFINNEKKFPRENRKKIFTSPKSAFLEGNYTVSTPDEGLFLLTPDSPSQRDAKEMEGRIGVFIDVFDATKSLNQDVVELFFVNPNDPSDFFMYCEHPENGDGKNADRS